MTCPVREVKPEDIAAIAVRLRAGSFRLEGRSGTPPRPSQVRLGLAEVDALEQVLLRDDLRLGGGRVHAVNCSGVGDHRQERRVADLVPLSVSISALNSGTPFARFSSTVISSRSSDAGSGCRSRASGR